MIYLPIALELAQERTRELERRALAAEAAYLAMSADPRQPRRPSLVRRALARPVRALSDASHALSEAACTAAARIEGTAH
ncbi:MAG: hypothetical protein ACYDAN_04790 [Candidatus Limnocylindrales bacterium]